MIELGERFQAGDWEGSPAWIIGGGPSFDPTVLERLPLGAVTVGTNAAWTVGPTFNLAIDERVTNKMLADERFPRICPHTVHLVHELQRAKERPDDFVVYAPKNHQWERSLSKGLPPTNNSGGAAICFAELMGANPIFLLGFDMRAKSKEENNWHQEHDARWNPNPSVYKGFISNIEKFAPHLESQVYIVDSPQSEIPCFPKISLDEALAIIGAAA